MLTDHRIEQTRWAQGKRDLHKLPWAFGSFIANLAPWEWFVTLTLHGRGPRRARSRERGEFRREGNCHDLSARARGLSDTDPTHGSRLPVSLYSQKRA
jgi:hypothetical protein